MRFMIIALVSSLAALLGGCADANIQNEPPKAMITHDGMVDPEGGFIVITGETVTLTLDASGSEDPDGEIVSYLWLNTGLTQGDRHSPDAGPPLDDAMRPLPNFPDAQESVSITVTLPAGPAMFSVWVTDDDGAVGMATVKLQVGPLVNFTPDATCLGEYVSASGELCETCVCSPNEGQGGCFDEYNNCYNSPDQAFSDLCIAVVECAAAVGCAGATCYAPDLCMAEIDAAAQYMGGDITSCSNTMLAGSDNPCRATNLLSACVANPDNCMTACQ